MTSLTQATSLSSDPEIRAAEIKAMRDQIASQRTQADDLIDFGLYDAAAQAQVRADRLQRRLDELENANAEG